MKTLLNLLKILALLALAGTSLGFGLCGAAGLSYTFGQNTLDTQVLALALGGFAIMVLLGWGVFRLAKFFFASEAADLPVIQRKDSDTTDHFEA